MEAVDQPPDGILRAVCALANDLGASNQSGFLLIGVEKNGTVVGVDEDGELDEQQQRLANRLRSEKLQPSPSVSVTTREFGDRTLLLVEVAPYPVPPVVAVDGTPWVRVGTTTRRATEADLQRLNERRPERTAPFDTRPLASATLEDLQQERLRSVWSAEREADDDGPFGAHSDYRNPLVTAKLVDAGYVQQLGRVVRRARRQLEANGNPPLDVEVDGFTRVIVRKRP